MATPQSRTPAGSPAPRPAARAGASATTPAGNRGSNAAPSPAPKTPAAGPVHRAAAATPAAAEAPLDHPAAADAKSRPAAAPAADDAIADALGAALSESESKTAAGAAESKKTRQQLTSVLGISISQARCAGHLKKALHDEKALERLAALREQMKGASGARAQALKEEADRIAASTVRLSSDTSIAVAVIWDIAVKELLLHGLAQAKSCSTGRGMMNIGHLHDGGAANLTCYPLYSGLEPYRSYSPAAEEARLKERRAAGGKAADKAAGPRKAKPPAAAPAADEHSKTSFNTYIENALRDVKKTGNFSATRTSGTLREYVAQIVASGIQMMAALAKIIVVDAVQARTMTADNVKVVVRLLLTEKGRPGEAIDALLRSVDEKLALHREHVAGEKAKKDASQSPEARAAAARKAADAERERKQKRLETARRAAAKAAEKAAELSSALEQGAAA